MTVIVDKLGRFSRKGSVTFTEIESSFDLESLDDVVDAPAIRIRFGNYADGRFLTLGRQLRLRGYRGHIRAAGNLVPDQFPMALRLGIDSVEITAEHALRCTEDQWVAHAQRTEASYQTRLSG